MNWVSLPRLNALRFAADPVPLSKLQRWCRNSVLPARRLGGEWFVDLAAFDGEKAPEISARAKHVLDKLRAA